MNTDSSQFLNSFLNLYWLRPETALWRTLDCILLTKYNFEGPILDVGCGDGLFSFTLAGGEIGQDFDTFLQVKDMEKFYANADIYDSYDDSKKPVIVKKPKYKISTGFDHKQNLLSKARDLGLYEELILGDANKEVKIPRKYKTIFSNILYWLDNYKNTLSDLSRLLDEDGKLLICVPSETFPEYSFYTQLFQKSKNQEWSWLSLIDRGRHSGNMKISRTYENWIADFDSCGLKVNSYHRYLSKEFLYIWDIGLRPLSPVLIEMANLLNNENRLQIKKKWIEILFPLLKPLVEMKWESEKTHPSGFFLFELVKK